MKNFKILEHSADLEIRVWGRSKEELFKKTMLAMEQALKPKIKNREIQTKIKIESENLEALLVDFLSEINYLNEVNQEIYQKIKFEKFFDTEIEADLFGKKVERFGLQIKGVTFHNLDIHQREDGLWEATIIFDI